MQNDSVDIFSSDTRFIEVSGSIFVFLGGFLLVSAGLCKWFGFSVCAEEWIPIFGGIFPQPELSTFYMALVLLILGISSRLFSPFGWSTSLVMLWIGLMVFGGMAINFSKYTAINPHAGLTDTIVLDICLSIMCGLSIIYLLLKPVRSLYWR
ncbi:hypothetical protein [Pontibacter sp. G13]|uniref:hypothetical protein n=1 Tax=Pontibacter sp. G13 TaxID=3074898 RepID=UPI00288BD109|nr:hypothetical protein [Pontibacter sp. G13]WNJ18099.1 hypothetical protein RJD25_24855 [Pontibacter sp. G13]